MEKFLMGNVVKLSGSLVIVTGHRTIKTKKEEYDVTDWVSFSSQNCSGSTRNDTHQKEEVCWECGPTVGEEEPDSECLYCKGKGYYMKSFPGFNTGKCLGRNVQEYITTRLTKNFDF